MKQYEPKYWNNRGRYNKQYHALCVKLVPEKGEASTDHGELLRVLGDLYYDVFNNGAWNFNNYLPEIKFLRSHWKALQSFGASREDIAIFTKKTVKQENFPVYDRVAEAVIRHAMKCEKGAKK